MKLLKSLCGLAAAAVLLTGTYAFADGAELMITNCDTTLNWSASVNGSDALESDSVNKTEGAGSVGATAINGKLNQIAFIPEAPIDVSAYRYVEFDMYFSDMTWFNDCGGAMIEFTSSGMCDQQSIRYQKGAMRICFEDNADAEHPGWYHMKLDLDNPQGAVNGKFDRTQFNYFRFYSVDPISTTPDYTMRIDNFRFTDGSSGYTVGSVSQESSGSSSDASDDASSSDASSENHDTAAEPDGNARLSEIIMIIIIIECAVIAAGILFAVYRFVIRRKKRR